MFLRALLASGQILRRKVDGWETLSQSLTRKELSGIRGS
jgi:hypothetical protein